MRAVDSLKSGLLKFWKNHKKALLIIAFGALLFETSIITLRSFDPIMPFWISIILYFSYFLLFLGVLLIVAKKKWYIASNILIVVMLVWLVEVCCFVLLGFPESQMKSFSAGEFEKDDRASYLGFGPISDTTYTEHTIGDRSDTLFSATYTIDKHGYRHTPEIDSLNGRYNLFFGCSIALGWGLNNDQTLAYHSQNTNKSRSYNFAWNGYGTNHMLAVLQNENLKKHVKESDGTAYYVFFWDHIQRSVGSMKYYTEWLYTSPYYYLDDGKLIRDRSFADGRYWQSKFYEVFSQSSIKKYFEVEHPFRLSDSHFDLVSEMILESKKEYKKQFGNDNFVVVIYPAYKDYTNSEMKRFLNYLEKKEIRYIDLTKVIEYGGKYTLNGDSHPNSETNAILAKEILERTK